MPKCKVCRRTIRGRRSNAKYCLDCLDKAYAVVAKNHWRKNRDKINKQQCFKLDRYDPGRVERRASRAVKREEIATLRASGVKCVEIARQFGCSRQAIYSCLKETRANA